VTKKITSEVVQAVFNLPWLVAQEAGLFAEEGLEVAGVGGPLPGSRRAAVDELVSSLLA